MDKLPQELIDHTIDDYHAAADPTERAMECCGLVCKRWLRRSRFHLFSDLTLSAGNLPDFVDIIERSSTSLLNFVRHLELQYHGPSPDPLLLSRLHRCPNLVSIDLHITGGSASVLMAWLNSDEALHTHLRAWSDNSDTLSRLDITVRLRRKQKLSLGTVIRIISCVPRIEALGLRNIYSLAGDPGVQPAFGPFESRLLHLDIQVFKDNLPGFSHCQ
ncbi:hypothetical protein B0H15DRAFT_290053 [Mycena belliarum]|uniref:Uncharacterized protein n=1 Tax=Mycena belliarum TaxID=1033014 RepID=A0AAD6U3V6_9AGAR|nr:hypothetical protein B0H15DRAFT_290053 [Mycena belliae]